jgi:hypothetical protein
MIIALARRPSGNQFRNTRCEDIGTGCHTIECAEGLADDDAAEITTKPTNATNDKKAAMIVDGGIETQLVVEDDNREAAFLITDSVEESALTIEGAEG